MADRYQAHIIIESTVLQFHHTETPDSDSSQQCGSKLRARNLFLLRYISRLRESYAVRTIKRRLLVSPEHFPQGAILGMQQHAAKWGMKQQRGKCQRSNSPRKPGMEFPLAHETQRNAAPEAARRTSRVLDVMLGRVEGSSVLPGLRRDPAEPQSHHMNSHLHICSLKMGASRRIVSISQLKCLTLKKKTSVFRG